MENILKGTGAFEIEVLAFWNARLGATILGFHKMKGRLSAIMTINLGRIHLTTPYFKSTEVYFDIPIALPALFLTGALLCF